jgi:hypothetical protein
MKIMADLQKPTKEQIEEGLKLLAKKYERDEKVKKGLIKGSYKKTADLDAAGKAARKLQYEKYAAKQAALRKKVADMKISVSQAEIDAQMKKK